MEIIDKYPPLHIPPCDLRLRVNDEGAQEVFDPQRRRWVRLTPEEWVRQHFVRYLLSPELGYPQGRVGNEISIRVGHVERRCDTVVFDEQGLPLAIVEYKAPGVPVSRRVFQQILLYNLSLRVRCLMVSNGLRHFCCRQEPGGTHFEFLRAIPRYEELLLPAREV